MSLKVWKFVLLEGSKYNGSAKIRSTLKVDQSVQKIGTVNNHLF